MPAATSGLVSPPDFLSHMPKSVVRALDESEVFRDALLSNSHPDPYGPIIALSSIDSYLDAAIRQQRRIAYAKSSIHKSFTGATGVRRGQSLFYDAHFYLISWARIAKLARFVRQTTKFPRIGLVLRKYRTALNDRIDARDHLEHFEDRLPGGKNRDKLHIPNDLLNMTNHHLTFGGRRVDIGPQSLSLLGIIRNDLFAAVLYDSLESLACHNEERFYLLLQKTESKVHTDRTIRKIKKLLKARV